MQCWWVIQASHTSSSCLPSLLTFPRCATHPSACSKLVLYVYAVQLVVGLCVYVLQVASYFSIVLCYAACEMLYAQFYKLASFGRAVNLVSLVEVVAGYQMSPVLPTEVRRATSRAERLTRLDGSTVECNNQNGGCLPMIVGIIAFECRLWVFEISIQPSRIVSRMTRRDRFHRLVPADGSEVASVLHHLTESMIMPTLRNSPASAMLAMPDNGSFSCILKSN